MELDTNLMKKNMKARKQIDTKKHKKAERLKD